MIPQDTVNKILDATQIEDVVGDFVPLKKRGANYTACCPFHNEKTPSFSVSPSKGIYKCFGCGKSGTAVGFVMEHEHLTYVEALKYLAKKYHIEVVEKEETPEEIANRQKSESLLLVSEYAMKFFQESLKTEQGQTIAYQYFRSRGLEDETIRKYGLGWAPLSRSAFSEAARAAGYKEEYLIETGLSVKNDNGDLRDRFYDRVMFPIHSDSGRVIAFGGRTLKTDKSVAKYVNSPETEIYIKSRSLYGIFFAKNEIAKQKKCILVEGYLDVLSMHQLGITNVVASSGTSLTFEQIKLIKRFTDNITICYDGDQAGINAAIKGTGRILKEGMNVKIVLLPDGKDPDDFARSHTKDQVLEYIGTNEQDFIAFLSELLLEQAGNDPLKKASLINEIADMISLIPDPMVRAMYARSTSQRFKVDEQLILNRINLTRADRIVEEQKREDQQRRRMENLSDMIPPPDQEQYPEGMPSIPAEGWQQAAGDVFEAPELVASEKELLEFLLENGCTVLKFDRDSPYYVEGMDTTVADFIDFSLQEDSAEFFNTLYKKVYDEYFVYYEEGLTQTQIRNRMTESADKDVSRVSKDLLTDKYQLTVSSYEKSLTSEATLLVTYVPRAIMSYQLNIVKRQLNGLIARLASVSDVTEQTNILSEIGKLNTCKTALTNRLGRV